MRYTLDELEKLRLIRLSGYNNEWDNYYDDVHTSNHDNFDCETAKFMDWLRRMEKRGRIEYLLQFYEDKDITDYKKNIKMIEYLHSGE